MKTGRIDFYLLLANKVASGRIPFSKARGYFLDYDEYVYWYKNFFIPISQANEAKKVAQRALATDIYVYQTLREHLPNIEKSIQQIKVVHDILLKDSTGQVYTTPENAKYLQKTVELLKLSDLSFDSEGLKQLENNLINLQKKAQHNIQIHKQEYEGFVAALLLGIL